VEGRRSAIAAFPKGRDFGARPGLVLRQMSTGDRTILGKISKRGNRYLRALFAQATRADDCALCARDIAGLALGADKAMCTSSWMNSRGGRAGGRLALWRVRHTSTNFRRSHLSGTDKVLQFRCR
jgi:Transposase IS116/IS110/IS902 family